MVHIHICGWFVDLLAGWLVWLFLRYFRTWEASGEIEVCTEEIVKVNGRVCNHHKLIDFIEFEDFDGSERS
jgi:hypothetical protein